MLRMRRAIDPVLFVTAATAFAVASLLPSTALAQDAGTGLDGGVVPSVYGSASSAVLAPPPSSGPSLRDWEWLYPQARGLPRPKSMAQDPAMLAQLELLNLPPTDPRRSELLLGPVPKFRPAILAPQRRERSQGSSWKSSRSLVAGGHTPVPLYLAEEVLDEVPSPVELATELALVSPIRFRRDHDFHASLFDRVDDGVRVVALVGDEAFPLRLRYERNRFADVVDVPRREMDVDGTTETVHESVDFGGETSARASNTLTLGPPFPPAASWCAFA
jgi:hypothetical protein